MPLDGNFMRIRREFEEVFLPPRAGWDPATPERATFVPGYVTLIAIAFALILTVVAMVAFAVVVGPALTYGH